MNKFLKSALAVCAIVPCAFTFGACNDKHKHTYSADWATSQTHHWHGKREISFCDTHFHNSN